MKRITASVLFLFFSLLSFSQTKLTYSGNSGYTLVERTNLRRYVNGKYVGLTSREVRSFISKADAPDGIKSAPLDKWYDGNFFVMEETLRNSKSVMAGIHEAIPSVFKISSDGKMTMIEDHGYPTFRSFPTYTSQQLKPGDSWKGEGERAVDPMNKGIFTRMPVLALYTFEGKEEYRGQEVYRIKAIWQTNYLFSNFNRDVKGDDSLKMATGGHKADIIVRAATGEAILINDNVDETFTYTDGTQVNLKGTISMFTEYPPAIDHDKLIIALNRIAKAAPAPKAKAQTPVKNSQKESRRLEGESGGSLSEAKPSSVSEKEKPASRGEVSKASGKAVAKANQKEKTAPDFGFGEAVIAEELPPLTDDTKQTKNKDKQNKKAKKDKKAEKVQEKAPPLQEEKASFRDKIASAKEAKEVSDTAGTNKNNMVYEETPAGIRLSVRDIKFQPDSALVVPGEKSRLDEIAEVLKLAPNSQFLIEGHTASVGKPAGEQQLSEERAKNIAVELSKRGISADRFICKGYGGNRPVASNATNEGRAQNRRVEITILE